MERSQAAGADSPPARALLQRMERISEDYWAAGWLTDLEYRLWQLAQGDTEAVAPGCTSSAEDGITLHRLADACQGWWAWDDAIHCVRFIPLDQWRKRVAETRRN